MPDSSDNRDELYRLAISHRRAGRVAAALGTLTRLEQLHPPFGGLFEETGFCLLAAQEPVKAVVAFARAVELNPSLLESWRALERLYAASGRTAEARTAAEQARQLAALPEEIRAACEKFYDG